MLGHGHLLAVKGQPGDVGRVARHVLVVVVVEVPHKVGDADPLPAVLHGGTLQQDVLGGQLDVGTIRRCTYLRFKVSYIQIILFHAFPSDDRSNLYAVKL